MVDVELKKRGVYLGKTGETGRYRVWLDVSAWDEEYEGGVGLLLYTDPKGNTAPMRTVKEFDGEKTKLYGYVTAEETKEAGTGVIEVRWENAGVVAKSDHFNTVVMASSYTGKDIGENTPDWVSELMTELNAVNVVLEEAAQVAEDVAAIRETIEGAETVAKAAALDSEAWAVGERDGEDVDEDDPTYGNNARKYAQDAGGSATFAQIERQTAEAWAVGKRNGQDVGSTDPAYHNNAKYYSEQAFSGTPEGYADLVGDVGDLKSAFGYSDGNLICDDNTSPGWINSAGWKTNTVDATKKQRVTDWMPVTVGDKYTIYLGVTGPFEIGVVFYSQKTDGNTALVQRTVYQTYLTDETTKYNFVTFTVPQTATYMRIYVNSCDESNYYLYNVTIKKPLGLQTLLNKYAIIDNKAETKTDISKVQSYANVDMMVALLQILKSVAYTQNNGAELLDSFYAGIGSEHAYDITIFTGWKYASRYANVGYKTNGKRITTGDIYYPIDLKYTYSMDFEFATTSKKWIDVYYLTDTAVDHIDDEEDYATSDYVETGWVEIVGTTFSFTPIDHKISGANPVAVRFSFAFGDEHNDSVTGNEITSISIERKVRL